MATGALSIKLRCASWQQLATIYKRDLSNGTMFLKASSPPPIGTPIRIDLTLPSSSVIVLTGVVQQHVADPQRGAGVELALTPIAAGSIWLIESALGSDKRSPTPATGVPIAPPPTTGDGGDLIAAETELTRALVAEAESLKKINPFLVLGVGYEAGDGDVRAAFGELTKRYHPDRFARYESTELRAVAAEIFILIRDAYRKLGNEAGRTQALAAIHRPAAPAGGPRLPTAQIPVRTPPTSTPARPAAEPIKRAEPPPAPPAAVPRVTIPMAAAPDPAVLQIQLQQLDQLLDEGRLDQALAGYHALAKRQPQERTLRAGIELCEGLLALNLRDRLEAAQRFETALEIDPSNERAARELADMRRQATNERKGLLSRLMGKREP
jgi:curved DNA-binding protein CbpA